MFINKLAKFLLNKSTSVSKFFFNNHLMILCFHEISDNPSKFQKKYDLNLSIASFEKLINDLSKIYTFISPEEILSTNLIPHSME